MVKVKCKDGEVTITEWQAGMLFTGNYSTYTYSGTVNDLALAILRAQQMFNSLSDKH